MVVKSNKRVLRRLPDRAILRLVSALARQAAREDHARQQAERPARLQLIAFARVHRFGLPRRSVTQALGPDSRARSSYPAVAEWPECAWISFAGHCGFWDSAGYRRPRKLNIAITITTAPMSQMILFIISLLSPGEARSSLVEEADRPVFAGWSSAGIKT